jgi:hypothetical protein
MLDLHVGFDSDPLLAMMGSALDRVGRQKCMVELPGIM